MSASAVACPRDGFHEGNGRSAYVRWNIRLSPRLRVLRVAHAFPLPGATPAARQSRFRGVSRTDRLLCSTHPSSVRRPRAAPVSPGAARAATRACRAP
ncbi:hypothetical protein EJP69_26390 [Variovorax gossypii]|uniref:Uncharacterized protein n=1 Tax=Variovorax gossypii TaxID=1679495 RepID=A0A431TDZ9_9BURK|nr:hypothetical protein EJP69_26390 [Variovorax gossypii]